MTFKIILGLIALLFALHAWSGAASAPISAILAFFYGLGALVQPAHEQFANARPMARAQRRVVS